MTITVKRVGREIVMLFNPSEEFSKLFTLVWSKDGWGEWCKDLGYRTYDDLLHPSAPMSWYEGRVAIPIHRSYDAMINGGRGRLELETPEAAREAYPALVEAIRHIMRSVIDRMIQALNDRDEVTLEFTLPSCLDEEDDL